MDVYGYIRVSTGKQAKDGLSLEAQRERITTYCLAMGHTVLGIVEEAGVSAKVPLSDRPSGFAGLLTPGVGVVACKLDRLFRDTLDCLEMVRHWEKEGITLHLLDLHVDTSTPFGKAFLTIAAAFAELEREKARERTLEGLVVAREKNHRPGPTPNGKRREGKAVVDDTMSTRAKELRGEGLSYRKIGEALTGEGFTAARGGALHATHIKRLLS
jgi:putative DNA-invertase from lambdoid prophage Rac